MIKKPKINLSAGRKKAKLTEEDVLHISKLAGLIVSSQEIKKFLKQLSEVLDYIEVLNKINTQGIEPTSQVTQLENVFREDETSPSLPIEEVLSGTKKKHNNFFKVKAILEK